MRELPASQCTKIDGSIYTLMSQIINIDIIIIHPKFSSYILFLPSTFQETFHTLLLTWLHEFCIADINLPSWIFKQTNEMLWLSPAAITAMSSLVAFFFALDKIPSYWTGAIAADERCIFFPTCADQINQTHWNLPIHGWIFEPEDDSKKRIAFLKLLAKSLQVSDPEQKNILKRRVSQWCCFYWFLLYFLF